MLGVLSAVQSSLGQVGSSAGGQTGVTQKQLEGAAASVASFRGENPTEAKAAADQAFNAIGGNRNGEITGTQLASFLHQAQSEASAKYQAAGSLVSNFVHGAAGLLGSATGLTA